MITFDVAEIEALLNSLDAAEEQEEEAVQVDEQAPVVSRVGDLWLLGDHALICGDATDPEVYRLLLGTEKAQMIFTDPPYNVPVNGHICGLGKVQHDEFVMASGEMTEGQFTQFLRTVAENRRPRPTDTSLTSDPIRNGRYPYGCFRIGLRRGECEDLRTEQSGPPGFGPVATFGRRGDR